MSAIKVTVHGTGNGMCSLSEKEGDGITVSFDDGTVRESFLSWKAFRQLLALKSTQSKKPEPARPPVMTSVPPAVPTVTPLK